MPPSATPGVKAQKRRTTARAANETYVYASRSRTNGLEPGFTILIFRLFPPSPRPYTILIFWCTRNFACPLNFVYSLTFSMHCRLNIHSLGWVFFPAKDRRHDCFSHPAAQTAEVIWDRHSCQTNENVDRRTLRMFRPSGLEAAGCDGISSERLRFRTTLLPAPPRPPCHSTSQPKSAFAKTKNGASVTRTKKPEYVRK